jgi:hypothetical protein
MGLPHSGMTMMKKMRVLFREMWVIGGLLDALALLLDVFTLWRHAWYCNAASDGTENS